MLKTVLLQLSRGDRKMPLSTAEIGKAKVYCLNLALPTQCQNFTR